MDVVRLLKRFSELYIMPDVHKMMFLNLLNKSC